ncbi:sulfurtransferase complex subunit TusB [Mannheimia massilioguelmaensis]|uniref:sulfurtransferase complex subunit TusB n=1 Tax=Mannheimia massilioguelmaensis TaxID=1604354 RepID=UPI0005C9E394|nr:sulfurtransferase complex subunit TusB [Mannheimia massilioguelmaensis]
MLYTFSESHYSQTELENYFSQITPNDAVVLWQSAVIISVKYPQLVSQYAQQIYLLEVDIQARGLTEIIQNTLPTIKQLTLSQFVALTEQYYPQLAL